MRQWCVLTVLCLALMLLGVDQTVVNVALPELQREMGLTAAQLQWIVGAYTLTLAAGVLAAGNWGDRRGRRRALVAGLWVCVAASVLGGVADDASLVVLARGLMGAGAALIMPATLSILVHVFTSPGRQRLAVTLWATVAGVGVLVGPLVGGWLLERYSWRACFWGNVPLALLALAGVTAVVPACRQERAPGADPVGLLLSSGGLAAVVWSLIQAPSHGWSSGLVLGVAAGGVVLLAAMVRWESRARSPMLPPALFRDRGYAVAVGALSLLFFTLVGATFALTFHLQGLLRLSPLEAGTTMVLGGLGVACGGALAAVAARWVTPRHLIVAGLVLCGGSFLVLAGVSAAADDVRLRLFLWLVGLGTGLTGGPATSLIMGAVPPGTAGVGAAVNDAVRSVGSTSGVAAMGSVFNTVYSSAMRERAPRGAAGGPGARDHLLSALAGARRLTAEAALAGGPRTPAGARRLRAADALVHDAQAAFLAALHHIAYLSAALCLTGSCAAAFLLWERGRVREALAPAPAVTEPGRLR
ncbi:MFS transporter [Streptomyces longispororuber]|uniref:MFS transporter n=1 Tax=Streptomyces longispororuber TaxID=68230 RepID=UPI0036F6B6F1